MIHCVDLIKFNQSLYIYSYINIYLFVYTYIQIKKMSQEDGALSTDVKEEPTEKIRSKYVHPSPEKNEITPLNKEESNKDSPKPVKKKDDVMQALSAFSRGKRTRKGTKVSMQGYVHEETEIVTNRMDVMDQHLMNIASLLDNLRNDGNNGKIQLPPIEQKADNIGADMKVPSSDVQNVNTIEEKKKEQEEVDSVN